MSEIDVETEARNMGWLPQEQFKGNPDMWVDAEAYVEKGRQITPILLANNKRLQDALLTRDAKIGTLATQLENATKAITRLEEHYTAANKRAVEIAREQLKEELKQARSDEDVDAEFKILEKLDELKKPADPPKDAPKKSDDAPVLDPEFVAWQKDNDWFGPDKKKTKLVTRIAEDLREDGEKSQGREFFDLCVAEYEKLHGEDQDSDKTHRPTSKVATSSRNGSRSSATKTFADLSSDAQRACMEDVDTFVGEGKRYKTVAEWQKRYTALYNAEG